MLSVCTLWQSSMFSTVQRNLPSRSYVITILFLFLMGCGTVQDTALQKPPFPMVTAENLFAVTAFDSHHAWAVGFNSCIVHTLDGGTNWEIQKSGVTVPLYDVDFVTPTAGWVAGRIGTILHTDDGGKVWKQQSSGIDRHLFGLDFVDKLCGWAVGEFGTILHTVNGGATWTSQGSGEDRIYNDVCFVDRNNGWVAGEYGLIYHTRDGGLNWELQVCQDIIPVVDETAWETPTPSLYSIWFLDNLRGWASGMDSIIIATADGGATWRKISNPIEKDRLTLYKVTAENGTTWAVGQKGTYLYSTDRGISWKRPENVTNTKFWLRDMDFADSQTGWAVGSRGTIIKTEDGGASWRMFSGIPLAFN